MMISFWVVGGGAGKKAYTHCALRRYVMKLHLHIHLDQIEELISIGASIMATVQELEAKVDTLIASSAAEKAEVMAALAEQATLLADARLLIEQLTAGQPATQAQIDAIAAKVDAANMAVQDIYTPTPPPTPVP
jgi:ATP-dependent protease ClpP protease subunit